jgi:uncharacterized protein YdgA (DUF945 family)
LAADHPARISGSGRASQSPIEGELLDLVAKMGVDRVLIGDQNYGPVHYDFSLWHLHARTGAAPMSQGQ